MRCTYFTVLGFVSAIVLGVCAECLAVTYYVDGTNGNDTYNGTSTQPWRTIAKANIIAEAGDTVLVRPGIYNYTIQPDNSGEAGRLITFKADTPASGQVILDGGDEIGIGVNLEDRKYIRVEGFEIRNFSGNGVNFTWVSGLPPKDSFVEIVGNYIHDCGTCGIGGRYAQTALIQNNEICNSPYGMFIEECRDLVVRENNIHLIDADGVWSINQESVLNPCNILFEKNRVYNANMASGLHKNAIQWRGHINGAIFRYNQVSDFEDLVYFSASPDDNFEIQDVNIYGNVFWNYLYWKTSRGLTVGILFDGRNNMDKFIKNIKVHSNTFGWLGKNPIRIYGDSIDGVTILDNIFSEELVDVDITVGAANAPGFEGPNSIKNADPQFVNYTGQDSTDFDFRLKSTSPAINSGDPQLGSFCTLPASFVDIDDTSRPQGTRYDIGAYEFKPINTNLPPQANAGPDQTVIDTDNNGSGQVTLDGSGSNDRDGSITSYVWREGGRQITTGVKPTVSLPIGRHTITLVVTDNGGLTDTDTVVIIVELMS